MSSIAICLSWLRRVFRIFARDFLACFLQVVPITWHFELVSSVGVRLIASDGLFETSVLFERVAVRRLTNCGVYCSFSVHESCSDSRVSNLLSLVIESAMLFVSLRTTVETTIAYSSHVDVSNPVKLALPMSPHYSSPFAVSTLGRRWISRITRTTFLYVLSP